MEWSDKMGSRSRAARLFVRDEVSGEFHEFNGDSIPGLVVVQSATPVSQGKWSHTRYVLQVSPLAHLVPTKMGWNTGTLMEGLCGEDRTLDALADRLECSEEEALAFLQKFAPEEAQAAEEVAAKTAELYDPTEVLEKFKVALAETRRRYKAIPYSEEAKSRRVLAHLGKLRAKRDTFLVETAREWGVEATHDDIMSALGSGARSWRAAMARLQARNAA